MMIDYDKHTTMTSGRDRWLWDLWHFSGVGLVWFGLGAPLVQLPVVGSVRFFETSLGGRWLGGNLCGGPGIGGIQSAMGTGIVAFLILHTGHAFAWLVGGLVFGHLSSGTHSRGRVF